MKTEQEKTIFFAEDFEGSGQYVILNREPFYKNTSYMTTLLYKVGYNNKSCLLIAMSDGMIEKEFNSADTLNENKRQLCDYLNSENYRPASHEELIRMALYQHRRCG